MLTDHQKTVAGNVIAEEEQKRRHLVVALSGAHAYGFPSPDSDLDIKGVHITRTRALLGLPRELPPAERLEIIANVEIDYSSNEIGSVVAGVLAGNGNYIERILGALILADSSELAEFSELTRAALSRKVFRHYSGFARNQRHALRTKEPTAKRLLYVLRTALTGLHLLTSGELRVDLRPNAEDYKIGHVLELIEFKTRGENVLLSDALYAQWNRRLDELIARMTAARESSPLPLAATNAEAFEQWLIERRVAELKSC